MPVPVLCAQVLNIATCFTARDLRAKRWLLLYNDTNVPVYVGQPCGYVFSAYFWKYL